MTFFIVSSDRCSGSSSFRFNAFLRTFILLSAECEDAVTCVQCSDTSDADVYKSVCIQSDLVRSQIVKNKFMPTLAVATIIKCTKGKAYPPQSN